MTGPNSITAGRSVRVETPQVVGVERCLLGCVLLDPDLCLEKVRERIGDDEVWFDLRNKEIWDGICKVWDKHGAVDMVLLSELLTKRGTLEQVGGLAMLSGMPDEVPSAVMFEPYLDEVWGHYLSRELVKRQRALAQAAAAAGQVDEALLGRWQREQQEFEALTRRGRVTPRFLRKPIEFGEEFWAKWFGGTGEEPGADLPIKFPLKIRPRETTLLSGDDGSGKSTLLGFFGIHLAAQGSRVVIGSFEMPGEVTLWILASQLLGAKKVPDTPDYHRKVNEALAWLNERVLIFDFVGIAQWREVLDSYRYAAEHMGFDTFILDSVMRIGIPDDDYAQQGFAATQFAQFAKDTSSHLFYVIHENKGGGDGKAKVRGSKLWTANADNVLRVQVNHKKGEKADKTRFELQQERAKRTPDLEHVAKLERELEGMRKDWDSQLVLQKQRFPGTVQNASKRFWFDPGNFQFRNHFEDPPAKWLEVFKRREARAAKEGAAGDNHENQEGDHE